MPQVAVSFSIDQSASRVWTFLQDVPAVAPCMPGVALTGGSGPSTHLGRVRIKLGPVAAEFEGEATIVESHPDERWARIEGKGVDRKGGSRTTARVTYRVTAEGADAAKVDIESNFTVTGALAQMGRVGIFQDVATQLTNQFAAALRDKLAAAPAPAEPMRAPEPAAARPPAQPASPISGGEIVIAVLKGLWRRLCTALRLAAK